MDEEIDEAASELNDVRSDVETDAAPADRDAPEASDPVDGDATGESDGAAADALGEAVDDLNAVQAGEGIDALPVASVERTDAEVRLTFSLPGGSTFTEALSIPPVWGANCDLATLLDAVGLDRDEIERLEGVRLPCDRDVTGSGIEFYLDMDAVAAEATESSARSPDADLGWTDE